MGQPIKPPTLDDLYDQHGRSLYAYACVLARSPAEAEDIVQNTFVRLARHRDRLAAARNLRGYLFSMLRNEAVRHRSRWHRWWYGDLAAGIVRFSEESADGPAGGDLPALGGGVPGDEAAAIQRAMGRLPPAQREVVYLKVWQEMTFAEIGELLGLSPNTAASQYRYGLAKLKGWLEHER
jgi:RNA polymerase sigma-70 factor (ECF subfamily)